MPPVGPATPVLDNPKVALNRISEGVIEFDISPQEVYTFSVYFGGEI